MNKILHMNIDQRRQLQEQAYKLAIQFSKNMLHFVYN